MQKESSDHFLLLIWDQTMQDIKRQFFKLNTNTEELVEKMLHKCTAFIVLLQCKMKESDIVRNSHGLGDQLHVGQRSLGSLLYNVECFYCTNTAAAPCDLPCVIYDCRSKLNLVDSCLKVRAS